MKFLVLVLSLGAVVFARPDVSHVINSGYHYKPPSTNYGVPVDHGHVGTSHHHHHHHVPSDSYGVPLDNKYSGSGQNNQGVPSGSYLPGNLQFQLPHLHSRADFLGSNTGNKYEGYNPHLIQDQKHVYYYAVPDDEEPARLRIHVTPSNKKNTNVIFVKAPSYAPAVPEVIVPQHQAEEKTKVFVLVKKPEQPAPISIPAPAPVKSHPEVYVVKYENQEEAERVLSGGRGGHPIGFNVHNLGDEASFVTALKSDIRQHIPHNDKYSGFDGNIDFFGARSGVRKDGGSSVVDVSVGGGNSNIGVSGNVPKSGSVDDSFGVQGGFINYSDGSSALGVRFGDSSSGSLGVSGGVGGSGSLTTFGASGGVKGSGSFNSFGAQVVENEKSDRAEPVVDSNKKSSIETIIGDEKSEVDSNKDYSGASGSIGVEGRLGGSSGVKNTVEIKTTGQEFASPLLDSFGKSALEVRVGDSERDDSLSGSITAGTEKSSVVDVTTKGVQFIQYGPPSLSGPY
ncbi:hypothetical protein ILUMI_09679 [Ignelater luminosus]|uniref:DUF243 domain-containing protein n=1 Tax=Ignelater luminosus TaxID=2038154 RepID=A0A8K0CZI5_IGNLU|nr:hypothetical protein ILUMI_09679 [Ignelater luminosus]